MNLTPLFWLAIVGLVIGGAYWLYRQGRRSERADTQKDILDAVAETKRATDNLRSDPDYAKRVREKYERVLPDR